LGVVAVDSNLIDTAAVLLKRAFHNLGLARDSPDADLTFLTTRDDSLAVVSGNECGTTVIVSVVDGVE